LWQKWRLANVVAASTFAKPQLQSDAAKVVAGKCGCPKIIAKREDCWMFACLLNI
jgi:hypothetical protein